MTLKPFLVFLAVLVLLNLARAQSSRNPRAGSDKRQNPLFDYVLVNAYGSPAARAPANAGVYVSFTSFAAPPDARKAYEKALREIRKKKPDLAKAANELETAVTLYPSFAAAWYLLGGIRLVFNDADSGRRAFEAALSADPTFPYPYLPLTAIELSARRYAEAARLADSVLKLDSRLMTAHYYRALANNMLRRYHNSKQSIQEIVDSGNDHQYPGVHAMLAVISLAEGDCQAAANEYALFLALDPESPSAGAARDYLAKWRAAAQGHGERQGTGGCR